MDTVVIDSIPGDATIKEAYLIFADWRKDSTAAQVVFANDSLSNGQIFVDVDDIFHLTTTVFDVTNSVTGNGLYDVEAFGMKYCYFMSLVIIFESPASEELNLYLNIGSESLQSDTTTTLFNFPNSHLGAQVVLLVQGADSNATKDEKVLFNDEIILGPGEVFFSNLGPFADQIIIDSVGVIAGVNKLQIITGSDWIGFHLAMVVYGDLVSSVEFKERPTAPKQISLKQNYPNPFNPSTNIPFDISASGKSIIDINLSVYNILGQKVATLYDGSIGVGGYTAKWNGLDDFGNQVPAGIYFYRLISEAFMQTKRMLLIK